VAFHLAPGSAGNIVYALCKGVLYGMPLVWLLFVVHQPLSLSPLKKDGGLRRSGLRFGVFSGLALGGGIFLLGSSVGHWQQPAPLYDIAVRSGFAEKWQYLLLAAHLCFVNALLEEYAFRWFLYGRCRVLLPPKTAMVVAALIFTTHHVIVLSAFFDWPLVLIASCGVFVGGLIWTWSYEKYNSIWPGYISHALVDVAVLAIGWKLVFG